MIIRRALLHAAITLGCLASASAQSFPSRTLTMIVPQAAGSSIDVLARIVASGMSRLLGRQVIVENVGGAGGMVGAARVARAAPDGYTFVFGTFGSQVVSQLLYKKPLYDSLSAFTPVALIAEQPIVLIVRRHLPVDDLQQFIAYTKANQSKMQYGAPGVGSAGHLACLLLNSAMHVKVTLVPYRGGPPAIQDLAAGRIDYQCSLIALAVPQIKSHAIKAIAILQRDRSPILPSQATASEQGLTDFSVVSWNAIFLPAGAPAAIVDKLHKAIAATMDTPSFREQVKGTGADVVGPEQRSPAFLRVFEEDEIKKWAGPVNAAHIHAVNQAGQD